MLYLQPRIHLQEIELPIFSQHEFHRARTDIAHRTRCGDGGSAHAHAQHVIHGRAGAFLHHLLVPPLYRTIALADVDDIAVPVAKYLYLNVARIEHGLFDQQLAVAKGIGRFAACGCDGGGQLRLLMHQPHAASAATGRRLDHHRQANLQRLGGQVGVALIAALVAWHARYARFQHQRLGVALVAHGRNSFRIGADEHQPRFLHGARERGALGQEAIAGVDGAATGIQRRPYQLVDHQIGLRGRRRAYRHRFIGL